MAEARVEVARLHPLGYDEELFEGHVDHDLMGEWMYTLRVGVRVSGVSITAWRV